MYLDRIKLTGIKCFDSLELEFQHSEKTGDPLSNWNVIIGNNGNGKTSILRMIAASQLGVIPAGKLLDMKDPVRRGEDSAQIYTEWIPQEGEIEDPRLKRKNVQVEYIFVRGGSSLGLGDSRQYFPATQLLEPTPLYKENFSGNYKQLKSDLDFFKEKVWLQKNCGWLCCGYGPTRRRTGWSIASERFKESEMDRFLTLFNEGAALFEGEDWLINLERLALRKKHGSIEERTFNEAKEILAEILPEVDQIIFEDEGFFFKFRGIQLELSQLSDGYRIMFVLAADLLRQIQAHRLPGEKLGETKGVVLIDEIDAHLHPQWQRHIGNELTRIFPNIQFIVTTHSPYVALSSGKGALHVLGITGEDSNEDMPPVSLLDVEDTRGWAIEHILEDAFHMQSMYSEQTQEKLERYDELFTKKRKNSLVGSEEDNLIKLEHELNVLMKGDDRAPYNQMMDEDMKFLMNELKGKAGQ